MGRHSDTRSRSCPPVRSEAAEVPRGAQWIFSAKHGPNGGAFGVGRSYGGACTIVVGDIRDRDVVATHGNHTGR
jgi:hypothetical protein